MHNCMETLQRRQTGRDGQRWARDGYHQEEPSCPRTGRQEAPHVDGPSPSQHFRASHLRAASELPSFPQVHVPASSVLGLGRGLWPPIIPAGKVADVSSDRLLCRLCDSSSLQAEMALPSLGAYLLLHTELMQMETPLSEDKQASGSDLSRCPTTIGSDEYPGLAAHAMTGC